MATLVQHGIIIIKTENSITLYAMGDAQGELAVDGSIPSLPLVNVNKGETA